MAAHGAATASSGQSYPGDGSGAAASATSPVDGSERDLTAGGISSTLSGNTLFTLMQLGNKEQAETNVSENEDEHALLTTAAARNSADLPSRSM
jgi:hypothetical protein